VAASNPARHRRLRDRHVRGEAGGTAHAQQQPRQGSALPAMIVIESEEFWSEYGNVIEANWEPQALRQYSSLDAESLTDLAEDPGWSNEGLFAFTQGLRRLGQIGGERASIPAITWEAAA
jgi:hypothetical protein